MASDAPPEDSEAAATLTAQHELEVDPIATAFDNSSPQSILMGHAKMAAFTVTGDRCDDSDTDHEEEAHHHSLKAAHLDSLEEYLRASQAFGAAQVAEAVPLATGSRPAPEPAPPSTNLSYSTNMPHQVFISTSPPSSSGSEQDGGEPTRPRSAQSPALARIGAARTSWPSS